MSKFYRLVRQIALPGLALIGLPFIYNSCQGPFRSASSGTGSATIPSTCKATLENGIVHELRASLLPPRPFANSKVRLFPAVRGQSKSVGENTVALGTELGVLMDNQCLREQADLAHESVISQSAILSGEMLPQLDRQTYLWRVTRNYSEDEIKTLSDQERCVLGIAWNREYKVSAIYNDPSLAIQPHLASLQAEEAYARFFNSTGGMANSGTPIVLAAVDTGVDYNHPDLNENIWRHSSGMGIDITSLGSALVNYYPLDISDSGHGTHVSGILAAVSNNAVGIVGSMPFRAKVMGIRIFKADASGNLTTTSQYFYNAIKFADLNGANVINLSLGAVKPGASSDALAESVLLEAAERGLVSVVVIGNAVGGEAGVLIDGVSMSSVPGQYATHAGIIGVGSVDSNSGGKSQFSHYSPVYAEIAAPGAEQMGTGIYSTLPLSLGSYGRLTGTSQAAPMVAAAAGLTMGLIREAYGILPSPAEVERLLLASAIKTPALNPYFTNGNRLNLLTLIKKINQDYPLTLKGDPIRLPASCR